MTADFKLNFELDGKVRDDKKAHLHVVRDHEGYAIKGIYEVHVKEITQQKRPVLQKLKKENFLEKLLKINDF